MDESGDLDSKDTPVEGVKVVGFYQLERMYSCIICKSEPSKSTTVISLAPVSYPKWFKYPV